MKICQAFKYKKLKFTFKQILYRGWYGWEIGRNQLSAKPVHLVPRLPGKGHREITSTENKGIPPKIIYIVKWRSPICVSAFWYYTDPSQKWDMFPFLGPKSRLRLWYWSNRDGQGADHDHRQFRNVILKYHLWDLRQFKGNPEDCRFWMIIDDDQRHHSHQDHQNHHLHDDDHH